MQTPLSSKVKGALGSLGSLVTSAQRQRTPAESPADPGSRQPYTDHYNFQLLATQKDIDTLRGCQDREAAQTARWQAYQQKGALPPKDELKKLCRKGVPPALREWVWMEVSGATRRRQQHHSSYFAAMAQIGKHESPFASQIELDLPRTFPANEWVQSEQGQVALRRVLCAFAKHKADVGYCQGLNYIAAMLLLAMGHDDEKAFWLLASLIDDDSEGILYQDMFASNLSGTHVEMRSLWELVQAKLPRLAAHLQAIKCDISILATDWFMCLFATTLPSETVTRVWDALFNEGPKLLFRCALALLKLHEGLLLAKQDPGELLQALRTASAESYDRDQLLKVAFGQVGSLPMTTIRRYRKQSQQQVDHEMAMRETNKNLQRALREGFVMPPDEVHVLRDAELESDAREEARARGAWGHKLEVLSEKAKETVGKGKERLMHMTRAGSQGQIGGGPGTAAEPQPAA